MPNGNNKAKQATVALFWISLVLLAIVVGLSIWAIVVCARSKEGFDGAAAKAGAKPAPLEVATEEDVACANLYACGPQNTITRQVTCNGTTCNPATKPLADYSCKSLPACSQWAQNCTGCPKCLPSGGTQQKCATPTCPTGDYCIGAQPPPSTCSAPPCGTWVQNCPVCPAPCGEKGTVTCSEATCPSGDYCDPTTKPPLTKPCDGPPCEWKEGLWNSNCGAGCDLETQKCDGSTQKCIEPRKAWCNTSTPTQCGIGTSPECQCCLQGDLASGGVPCPGAPSSCSTGGPCMVKNVTTT